MRKALIKVYSREEFNPRIIGLFLPDYFVTKALHHNMSKLTPRLSGRLLDIGCGAKPYKDMCINVDEHLGIEIDDEYPLQKSDADYLYDGKVMPIGDKSFDSALASEVLEHVFNPDVFFKEVNRVLKVDALFLISTPFLYKEHGQPHDYARYTSFGLEHILNEHGFEVVKKIKTGNGIEVFFQGVSSYIFKVFKLRFPFILLIFPLIFLMNVFGLVLSKVLPRNDDMYLENIFLAKKVKDL